MDLAGLLNWGIAFLSHNKKALRIHEKVEISYPFVSSGELSLKEYLTESCIP